MRNSIPPQRNRIIGQEVHDESGNLIAQEIFEVSTKSSSQSIHRSVRLITRFKDKDNEFKEIVLTEAMAVFPAIIESDILMQYFSAGFKPSEYIETDSVEEVIAEENQIPVTV